jgi:hypothetical protein
VYITVAKFLERVKPGSCAKVINWPLVWWIDIPRWKEHRIGDSSKAKKTLAIAIRWGHVCEKGQYRSRDRGTDEEVLTAAPWNWDPYNLFYSSGSMTLVFHRCLVTHKSSQALFLWIEVYCLLPGKRYTDSTPLIFLYPQTSDRFRSYFASFFQYRVSVILTTKATHVFGNVIHYNR